MVVYHMSETLKLDQELRPDYQNNMGLVLPFVQALEQSVDCYYAMVLNGKYLRAVLRKSGLREWSNYVKWSVEGAFEYIRRTEFPEVCSRMQCNYFYEDISNCKRLFDDDWGEASEEEQAAVRLYEIELSDEAPQKADMRVYDEAYAAMEERQDVQLVLDCARRYFAGGHSSDPVWEIISGKPARAVRDITAFLHA